MAINERVTGNDSVAITGVIGQSKTWMGVHGSTESTTGGAGVMGEAAVGAGAGIYGKGGRVAGYFEDDVEVTGDIRLANADCAEDFNIGTGAQAAKPLPLAAKNFCVDEIAAD